MRIGGVGGGAVGGWYSGAGGPAEGELLMGASRVGAEDAGRGRRAGVADEVRR